MRLTSAKPIRRRILKTVTQCIIQHNVQRIGSRLHGKKHRLICAIFHIVYRGCKICLAVHFHTPCITTERLCAVQDRHRLNVNLTEMSCGIYFCPGNITQVWASSEVLCPYVETPMSRVAWTRVSVRPPVSSQCTFSAPVLLKILVGFLLKCQVFVEENKKQ